ncbi:MAG: 23S rRNA (uracil(1939)-C(5))-methyltransferase RlmD [Bacteroidota bacterium]|nr:23S rRNA (uracil(1939)-C(5))-methyltransferase RlmD [Bacteroidota bacterium]
MTYRMKNLPLLESLEITDIGSEGVSVGRYNDIVVFTKYAIPGDIVDLQVYKKKKSFMEGRVVKIHKYSDKRTDPICSHFETCGGCKWQNLKYEQQLYYKQKQVEDNFTRIGKFDIPKINDILASEDIYYYRNKLEFTFSDKRYLTNEEYYSEIQPDELNAIGFHIPGVYYKVIDIQKCFLQREPSNSIRIAVKEYALKNGLSFFNIKQQTGLLRNMQIRTSSTGETMVIVSFNGNDEEKIEGLMSFITEKFPEVTSLMYVVNEKKNSIITDLGIQLYKGNPYIIEKTGDLSFKIGPNSFFQTNSKQAFNLFSVVKKFAELTGKEVVYDLYTGTGTIANFVAGNAKKVVGIEYVEPAIIDAIENSRINNIKNTYFYAGDMVKVLNDEFIAVNDKPDVIITDPPRAGMHEKVINQILKIEPEKIVYVSCNPATQARDISLLSDKYKVNIVQPVDMFPHTHHVECVVQLLKCC